MPSLRQRFLANLPGFTGEKTYASWPVWADSTRNEVKFQPMPKKAAVRLWHRAREFDRQTKHGAGRHGGAVGPTALRVLETLVFDFLNHRTGRLDPSYEAIAKKANICVRAVASGLRRLKELRILHWVRRCKEAQRDNGQFELRQESNAYAVQPSSGWLGYREPPEAPPPMAGTWGAPARVLGMIEQADEEQRRGATVRERAVILATDPGNMVALALAKLGGTMVATGRAV